MNKKLSAALDFSSTSEIRISKVTKRDMVELAANFDVGAARKKLESLSPDASPGFLESQLMSLTLDHVLRSIQDLRNEAGALSDTNIEYLAKLTVLERQVLILQTVGLKKMVHMLLEQRQTTAESGGRGRSAKLSELENETLRLYAEGMDKWPVGKRHATGAALAITPLVVAFSKGKGTELMPETQKPLEWIRAHIKLNKEASAKHKEQ